MVGIGLEVIIVYNTELVVIEQTRSLLSTMYL
jgi:hypothetical protein